MPDKPRNFKEVVANQDPADRARLANAESFEDVTVSNPFHQQVTASRTPIWPNGCSETFPA